ncbi:hypothetical protein P0Y35_12455 [Kiritimatiellaeota bacterium B1221]|nr:hypothetical protein [Kiritimatiellaeota bacterium B1221]
MDLWWEEPVEKVEILKAESGQFEAVIREFASSPPYDNFSRAWYAYRSRLARRDKTLREVVAVSRETGVLLPDTAYIVVENAAQEKMLKLKEQQKLMGQDALAFMDTPEPELVLMVLAACLMAWGHRRSRS